MNDNLSNKTYIFIILYLLGIVYIFLNYSYSNESQSNYWTIIGALAQGFAAVGTFCVLYISQQEFKKKYEHSVKIYTINTANFLPDNSFIYFLDIYVINTGIPNINLSKCVINYKENPPTIIKTTKIELNGITLSSGESKCISKITGEEISKYLKQQQEIEIQLFLTTGEMFEHTVEQAPSLNTIK